MIKSLYFCHSQLDVMFHPSHVSQNQATSYRRAVLKTHVWSSSLPEKMIGDEGSFYFENGGKLLLPLFHWWQAKNWVYSSVWAVQLILYLLEQGTRHFLHSHPNLNRNVNSAHSVDKHIIFLINGNDPLLFEEFVVAKPIFRSNSMNIFVFIHISYSYWDRDHQRNISSDELLWSSCSMIWRLQWMTNKWTKSHFSKTSRFILCFVSS